VKKGSKMCCCTLGGIPTPESRTDSFPYAPGLRPGKASVARS
jgi:hypothetical protein